MRAQWDGDMTAMGRLAEHVGRLTRVPSRAAVPVAEGLFALLYEEFETGTDPYGEPWQELTEYTLAKRSQTTEPPLTDYGEMKDSLSVDALPGAGVAITIGTPDKPAAPHQTGWAGPQGTGPARPILPMAAFPKAWNKVVSDAVGREVFGELRRRR